MLNRPWLLQQEVMLVPANCRATGQAPDNLSPAPGLWEYRSAGVQSPRMNLDLHRAEPVTSVTHNAIAVRYAGWGERGKLASTQKLRHQLVFTGCAGQRRRGCYSGRFRFNCAHSKST